MMEQNIRIFNIRDLPTRHFNNFILVWNDGFTYNIITLYIYFDAIINEYIYL